jgi:TPR repeat protein
MTAAMKKWIPLFFGLLASVMASASDPMSKIDDLIRANQFSEAVALTKEVAETGDVEGEFRMALFYWHGVGIGQNYLEALRWVTLAALSGHEKAIAARKLMLPSVDAVNWPKTLAWARERLQTNAEAGNNRYLIALSKSYSSEFGFENVVEAYYWASLAVAVGENALLKQRDGLSKKIAVVDMAKVQERIATWLDKWRKDKS